jgi:hypothetical protein
VHQDASSVDLTGDDAINAPFAYTPKPGLSVDIFNSGHKPAGASLLAIAASQSPLK